MAAVFSAERIGEGTQHQRHLRARELRRGRRSSRRSGSAKAPGAFATGVIRFNVTAVLLGRATGHDVGPIARDAACSASTWPPVFSAERSSVTPLVFISAGRPMMLAV
ncbi:hypothetical protein [Pendulispora rubella]|uniref:hypothetical protein n=1 Tax=Pendulispora rubella TaxID=2741070 RepID=UPI0038B2DF55